MASGSEIHFLAGSSECQAIARAFDWTTTALGARETWSGSLKAIVGMLFHSRHPMLLWWGKDLIQICNDAYNSRRGARRGEALSRRLEIRNLHRAVVGYLVMIPVDRRKGRAGPGPQWKR